MNALLFSFLLCLPFQSQGETRTNPTKQKIDDFSQAGKDYDNSIPRPTEVVNMYETRILATKKRIHFLEAQIQANRKALKAIEVLEVERYVALRTHFKGKELERRLKDATQDLQVRREGLEQKNAMEKADLEDANRRLHELEIELRLARIQVGLSQTPDKNPINSLSLKLAKKSQNFLLQRALQVDKFQYKPTPLSWVRFQR